MMNVLKIIVFLLINAIPAFASSSTTEMKLNNYYREQAFKQLGFSIPQGKFNIDLNVTVDEKKIKEEAEFQSLKLPMGDSFVSGNELQANGALDTSIEHLSTFVKKIEIVVSIDSSVSQELHEAITSTLTIGLGLDTKRGDVINIKALPSSYQSLWSSYDSFKLPLLVGGVLFLLGIAAIYFGFRRMGNLISSETRNLAITLKDVFDGGIKNTGMGTGMQPAMSTMNDPVQSKDVGFDNGQAAFWEKVDVDTLTAFCFDCMNHPRYRSVPTVLISTLLDPGKSAELEKKIPASAYQNVLIDPSLKHTEIMSLFQKNQSEYRRAMRSPMSRQIIGVPMEQITEFSKSLKQMEIALLINSLSPLRRAALLKVLPAESKMDLAEAAKKNITAVEHKSLELSFTEKTAKLVTLADKSDDLLSMDYLSAIILKADTFTDDESIYEQAKKSGKSEYISVLMVFDLFEKAEWEELQLQELALAFCGYSNTVKEKLYSQYTGKKIEWLKNFMSKFEAQLPEFHSPQVENAQDILKERIKNKLKNATRKNNGPQKQAS